MTQRLLFLVVSLWLSMLSNISAQVAFHLPFLNNISSGAYITVPVTVSNFDSIVSAQFVIQWDPQQLHFNQVLSYGLPGMDNEDFGLTQAQDSGLLRFAWSAPSLQNGATVADNSLIFRLSFQVIGEVDSSTSIIFTEVPPTLFEVIQLGHPAYNQEDCTLTNGFVAIGYTVATHDLPGDLPWPVRISPNPVSGNTTAFFDLNEAAEVQMLLTDTRGRVLINKKNSYTSGQHGMEIVCDQLQENGIYFLILRTDDHSCICPLVKID
ncbi:MAG: T9SS type A sorting domain-containing protein [Saprospiraceae bacterium]|nr:T9SS type A sorting domain-containing protein [Saprospiraceae bacterium]